MNKSTLGLLVFAAFAALPAAAQYGQAPVTPWYIGAGFGQGHFGVSGTDLTGLNNASVDKTDNTYTVRAGESLYGIAEACYGDCRQWRMISAANGNVRPESLMAGQQLRLPVQQVEAPSPGSVAYPTTGHW